MEARKQRKFNEKLKFLRKLNDRIERISYGSFHNKNWDLCNKRTHLYKNVKKHYKYKVLHYSIWEHKNVSNSIDNIKSINELYTWNDYRGTLLAFAIYENNYNYIKKLLDMGAKIDVENILGSKPTSLTGRQEFYTINYLLSLLNSNKCMLKEYKSNKSFANSIKNITNILKLLFEKGLVIENIGVCENLFNKEKDLSRYYHNKMKVHKILILKLKLPEEILTHIFDLLFNIQIHNRLKNLLEKIY